MIRTLSKLHKDPRFYLLLIGTISFCIIFYIYCVRQTVFNVVKRQQFESELQDLRGKISKLEAQNMSIKNNITIETAYAMGFKESSSPLYLVRGALGVALSEGNEI